MTNQPSWKCIANLGDCSPVDHSGFFVFIDETGIYPPEVELIKTPEDYLWDSDGWHPDSRWASHRWSLEPHTHKDGILSDNPFHPHLSAWYAGRLEEVSRYAGCDVSELVDALTGDDPVEKARAYRALVDYFGPEEFDGYPIRFDHKEITERTERYLKDLEDLGPAS